jgi:hypothetical protein
MYLRFTTLGSLLGLILLTESSQGANLTTTNVQASGANWTAAIWKTNSTGMGTNGAAGLAPVAANTYEMVANPIGIGNGLNNTRVRNPATAGTQTFPGVSLTMYTNTELRGKQAGAVLDFPGVGGNPGLILVGGMLNGGDDATFPITGRIQVQSQSYISHGANGGGGGISANRGFNISGYLSGSGNMVIINAGTAVPQQITGATNTYSGQWIVQCGWLQGNALGSLGTNSITVDPGYSGFLTVMPSATSPAGPAWFEPGYDINSAGVLTLTNGGILRLHQNCIFSSVVIEGTSLGAGTHSYCELVGAYAANVAPAGSGSITVRPYGLAPIVATPPQSDVVYAGGSARFSVGAVGGTPFSYQWRKNTVNLTDGGNISGSSSATLVIANVSAGDAASYDVIVSNATSTATSAAGTLTILTPSETYETAIANALPYAFYQLNDTGDPAACGGTLAVDNGGGFNGVYGNTVQNGNIAYNIAGPTSSDGFPGFSAANKAASFINLSPGSRITLPALNLKTNTVTMMAWIKPSGPQGFFEGIVLSRGGDTIAGLNYSGSTDLGGNTTIGYTWNNEGESYNWNSGISAPASIWSLVALVVTPTNATIHLMNTNGLVSATHTYPHVVQSFNGTTFIGADSADGGNGARGFAGVIDDVAIFNRALSKTELAGIFSTASGVSTYAPIIVNQPSPLSLYAGQTAQFNVAAGGSEPLTYQWQKAATGSGIYNNVTDGGQISGAQSGTLTIGNIGNPDAADYIVIVANGAGSVTSVVANLSVQSTIAAGNITMSVQQAANADWDTVIQWSDGQAASVSAASAPANTYELLAGSRMRTPIAPRTANFPGSLLKVDGNGVWVNNPAAGNTTIAEIRFKQPNLGVGNGIVNFPKLVMNGGQLDLGDPGVVQVGGEIDILTNAPFYNDSAFDQGYLINAWLTGGSTSSIEYHGYNITTFQTSYSNNLNIAGTSNTFSGKWNVVVGTLLGTGPNSLGTNDITVAAGGALETAYDVNNPNANLFLTGRVFLHQNDTFKSLFVNGVPLNPGTYTFAQLNATYPNNFPATWTLQNGSSANTGSGSITVLVQPAPTIVQQPLSLSLYPNQTASFTVQAQGNPPLGYRWRKGTTFLSDNPNLIGSATTNLTIPLVTPSDAGNYTVVVSNSVGSVTSVVATLTVLPTGPPLNITLDYGGIPVVQPQGSDWNTPTNWSDGNPASLSVYANPGSTYDVVVGSRLRPPAGTNFAVFPGSVLKVEGSGVFENGTVTAVGEFRFKHPDPGTNVFPKLVLNGGQLDNGDNGNIVVLGEIDVISNSVIYVDTAAGVDRGVQINAWLTGSGDLTWSQWGIALGGPDLNITGTSNTFSGRWNVAQGTLLGSGTNSLGPNDITVAATGALETLYDINNSNGSLILDGQMFLHQNDTFKSVTVAGTPLAAGTYSWAQLNSTYSANFPATWTLQAGSTTNAGSGSITVLTGGSQVTLGFQFNGSSLTLTWSQGILLEADDVTGPWTTNLTASPPSFIVTPTAPRKFYRIQVQ